jgi:hypothetical protein
MTKDTGGPAFPRSGVKDGYGKVVGDVKGMTLRQYAAIKLRVPDSGTDWLDDMIREGRRMDYAGQALAGSLANSNDDFSEPPVKWANANADAMIAERNK